MKTWVIPDIHGCVKTLKYLVEVLVKLQKDDTLYILGDLIDRGPDSKGVIDYIMQLESDGFNVITLRGNHEDYMIKVYENGKKPTLRSRLGFNGKLQKEWFQFGGDATIKSFGSSRISSIPESYINWMKSLPYYSSYKNFLIVHAGFNFKKDDIFEDKESMLWIRDYEILPEKLGDKIIIHGHVPVDLEFLYSCLNSNTYHFIALDNGVYMYDRPGYGNLTALDLDTLDIKIQPNLDQQ